MEEGIRFYRQRSGAEKFIAYFQAYTNTYGAPELLKLRYDEALGHPDVIGLSIGTRPDCIDDEILDLLEVYGSCVDLWIEYGLQSMHDETLRRVNRGHNFQQFCEAVQRTRARGMRVCAHLILGMPGEDRAMMMQTAEAVARLGVDGVKITHLYVARSTPLELSFQRGEFSILSLEGYIALLCDTLERIPPGVVIQRVMGELGGPYVVAPLWQKSKREILDRVDEEFAQRGTRQGSRVKESRETVGSAF
jgi:radical SAM protein (TIGR01212 family)